MGERICGWSLGFFSECKVVRGGTVSEATDSIVGIEPAERDHGDVVLANTCIPPCLLLFRYALAHAHPNPPAGRKYGDLPRSQAGKCGCVGGILQLECVECQNRYHISKSLFDFSCESKSLVSDLVEFNFLEEQCHCVHACRAYCNLSYKLAFSGWYDSAHAGKQVWKDQRGSVAIGKQSARQPEELHETGHLLRSLHFHSSHCRCETSRRADTVHTTR